MRFYMKKGLSVSELENRLKTKGIPVARMCVAAGISQSTWHRIKFNGVQPRLTTCRAVLRAVDELTAAATQAAGEAA